MFIKLLAEQDTLGILTATDIFLKKNKLEKRKKKGKKKKK